MDDTVMLKRCHWCLNDDLYQRYHDLEWGVPVRDSQKLFEFLILETMQAGLSWITILRKRENYLQAFDQFDAEKIVKYSAKKVDSLLLNPGIIRHRAKVNSIINNAKAFLKLQETSNGFANFLWQFTEGAVIQNRWQRSTDIPTATPQAMQMSKQLKRQQFSFVGDKVCYAFMQAVGMVNDHLVACYRHAEVSKLR